METEKRKGGGGREDRQEHKDDNRKGAQAYSAEDLLPSHHTLDLACG